MPIDLQGLEEIQRKLQALESSLDEAGMRRKLNTVGGMIKNSVMESFENETSPFGQRWKPLSSVTAFANFGGGGIKNFFKRIRRGRQQENFSAFWSACRALGCKSWRKERYGLKQ